MNRSLKTVITNDETIVHLENLYNTESLKNEDMYKEFMNLAKTLGKKLNNFIISVHQKLNTLSEPLKNYH